jgi:hypothetical protein
MIYKTESVEILTFENEFRMNFNKLRFSNHLFLDMFYNDGKINQHSAKNNG